MVTTTNTRTPVDPIEVHFSLALGHFLLSLLLIPALKLGVPSRIVTMASCYHRLGVWNVPTKKVYGEKVKTWQFKLEALHSYGRSKLANIWFSRMLGQKLEVTGITAYSVHPGHIATGEQVKLPWSFLRVDCDIMSR